MHKFWFGLAAVILLSYFSVKPLFMSGFFPMHDDTQVARVVVMGNALKNGQFPVRLVSGLGYNLGYPIYNFYGPLPYYFGGLLYSVGIDGLTAAKVMFGAGIILAAVTMYILGLRMFGSIYGVVAAVFYLYVPYHALDIYVRGAVGEYWAMGFFPVIGLGIYAAVNRKFRRSVLYICIGLAGTILSHTLLGFVTTIILGLTIAVVYFMNRSVQVFRILLLGTMTGLMLSAFFWLPAVWEMGYTNVSGQIGATADFRDHFVCLNQLWDSPWGYGGSAPGCIDGMSFKLGKIYVFLSVLSLVLIYIFKKKHDGIITIAFISLGVILFSVFMTLSWSQYVWQLFPPLAYLQYPWRFLAYAEFGLAFLSALFLIFIRNGWLRAGLAVTVIAACIYFNGKLFQPKYIFQTSAAQLDSQADISYRVSKISDEYLPPGVKKPKTEAEAIDQPLVAVPDYVTSDPAVVTETYNKIFLDSEYKFKMIFRKVYFPGWVYWVNGKITAPKIVNGMPEFELNSGNTVFEALFINTPVRTISNLVSLATLIIILYAYGKKTHT